MARLTVIRLYGALGARFGRVHHLAVETSVEAVKALCVMLDGFEGYLMNAQKRGMVFSVFRGKKNIGVDDFQSMGGKADIRIAPIMSGSKKAGMFQTILGAVMVVAGIALGPAGWGVLGSTVASGMALSGGVMMAGGIYQMLSPVPTGLQGREDPDNKPSYAFGGAVNSTAMGNPVAVLWGEREIGGNIISAGIVAEDI